MARKLTLEQERDLENLRFACPTILDYFAPSGALGQLEEGFRTAVETAYSRRDLCELRDFRRDFQEWLRDLPADARSDLEKMIVPPPDDVGKALAKGRIDTDDEYRGVLTRVEEIYDDPARESEVIRLNSLLTDYHSRFIR